MAYVDPAGFGDTEGVEQEIANAYSYERMFQRGSKMKLAIVVQKGELYNQRGGPLIGIMQRIFAMFPHDIETIQDTTCIFITKGKLRDSMEDQLLDWNYSDRLKKEQEKLAKKVIDIVSKYDSVYQKQGIRFVEHLAEMNRIIVLPHASQINPIIITQVRESLLKLSSRTLQVDVSISLGNKAGMFLNDYKDTLIEDFEEVKKHIVTKIDEIYNLGKSSDLKEISKAQSELNETITVFSKMQQIQTEANLRNQLYDQFHTLHFDLSLTNQIMMIFDKVNFCSKIQRKINFSILRVEQLIGHLEVKQEQIMKRLQQIVSEEREKKLQEELKMKNEQLQKKFEEDREKERKQQEEKDKRIRQNLERENQQLRAKVRSYQSRRSSSGRGGGGECKII